ncbi:hypothetical protein F66182_442 [Fusarium sp. NRRL 66182]|nr:hypothetical protein F66182_442 [Fusarium sp. NRRL 66182]
MAYSVTTSQVWGNQPVTLVVNETNLTTTTVAPEDDGKYLGNIYVPSISTTAGVSGSWTQSSASASIPVTESDASPAETSMVSSTIDSEAPTPTLTDAPGPSPKGLSGGAAAGVAIGCLIAGLLLGVVAALFLSRRRRTESNPSAGMVKTERNETEPKGGSHVMVVPSQSDAELSQFLLEATPDKEMQGELRSLSELIYQHVESYYRGPRVKADPAELAQNLVNIGYSPEASGRRWSPLRPCLCEQGNYW